MRRFGFPTLFAAEGGGHGKRISKRRATNKVVTKHLVIVPSKNVTVQSTAVTDALENKKGAGSRHWVPAPAVLSLDLPGRIWTVLGMRHSRAAIDPLRIKPWKLRSDRGGKCVLLHEMAGGRHKNAEPYGGGSESLITGRLFHVIRVFNSTGEYMALCVSEHIVVKNKRAPALGRQSGAHAVLHCPAAVLAFMQSRERGASRSASECVQVSACAVTLSLRGRPICTVANIGAPRSQGDCKRRAGDSRRAGPDFRGSVQHAPTRTSVR